MSKRLRGTRGRVPTRRQGSSSYVIPIVVGAVVLTIVVGAILSAQNRQSMPTGAPGEALLQANTPEALDVGSIPYPDVPRMPLQEVQAMLEQGKAILVDVRSKQSYDAGHAANAISIPEEEMAARQGELPRDKEIILYCT